ncbi:tRNA-i(6)A37 thiotransferase enzyme MiaB [Fluviicoccus keumensis]|uniref:tRNA-2-methylthio-N(6)-dimethylallyladenosine synthase n=1 Tax=Fluviicoccus keumensis TaxID=1435465 RepID=A0A4Q7ZDS8_9GAMM|nr:tRNA-i(6)A37 thiotransferase enzyme MiaB [Fluviicoccus keumensis]
MSTTPTQPKKVYIETQGCQMNEYDSSRMADLLGSSHGMVRTHTPDDADVLLLNTCSIREKAQEKVFSELGRWRQMKEKRPELVIGVGGCVASQEGDNIQKRAPFVDVVFGPQTLHRLPKMLDARDSRKITLVDVSFPEIEKFDFLPEPKVEGHKAFVSIMEGCSKYCTFCVVPYTRGEEVSRPFDDVIAEVAHLAAQGVREVTLLGQNVNGYRGAFHDGEICSFAELLRHVAEVPGIGRIRYTTSHPLEFGDDLIAAYADIPQLVSHVHLPVQSGSDNVLAAMKRNHTVADYRQRIQKLMAVRPDMHISSDFIIGFPGETDADFEATMNLIAEIGYDHSYSFIYSKRPGTPAAELPDPTPEADKKQRLHILKERIRQQTQRKTEAMLGKRERLLVERESDRYPGHLIGIAGNTRWVHFPGDAGLIGKFVDVDILEVASINSLLGSAPVIMEA